MELQLKFMVFSFQIQHIEGSADIESIYYLRIYLDKVYVVLKKRSINKSTIIEYDPSTNQFSYYSSISGIIIFAFDWDGNG